jgi:hypothetical protein
MKGCRGLVRKESRLQWVGYTEETGVTHQHLLRGLAIRRGKTGTFTR